VTARSIHNENYPDRVAPMALSLAKLYLSKANTKTKNPYSPELAEVSEALTYLKMATQNDPKNAEAWKMLGFVHEKLGHAKESQEAFQKAYALTPNDPTWKTVPAPAK
jgi:cytochrome c-type biogenesis protein CcmH/NrfG